MRPPFILIDGGDINLFGSENSLVRYVESPDVASYTVFDSLGKRLDFSATPDVVEFHGLKLSGVTPVKLVESDSGFDGGELSEIISKFIQRSFGEDVGGRDLHQLISMLESRLGMTK
ncbi:hypothetical protein [Xanthomonas indica]|uniref:Uncharacterized protein n=1 Tax=Xanthomonas indica TaxID=2912242 RepID=A0AAU8IAV6_9XANT|nr:hypothetical protein [Xanthomonas indica]MCI2260286.1 hypothetical protein [Xanthomonas indica]